MVPRLVHLAWLAVAFAAAGAAPSAMASTVLGSPDPGASPDGFVCDDGCGDAALGVRQLTLGGEPVAVEEPGVVTSVQAHAVRLAAGDDPRVAVVRPGAGGSMTVVDSAPVPVDATVEGTVSEATDLRLAVQPGDSIGFLFHPGEIDLGTRLDDGAPFVRFPTPCAPCTASQGGARELLFNASVEPDADGDGLGDESEDPDAGGGAEPAEPAPPPDPAAGRRARRGGLALLRARHRPRGGVILTLRVPAAGQLWAVATGRRPNGAPLTLARGQAVASDAGRVRLALRPSPPGHALLARVPYLNARLRVGFWPDTGMASGLSRKLRLRHFGRYAPHHHHHTRHRHH
jgi:hypothetical protein